MNDDVLCHISSLEDLEKRLFGLVRPDHKV